MSEELEPPRAEAAALRAEVVGEPDARFTRRRLLTGLAGLGAVGAAGVAGAKPAAAADGEPLLLGSANEATQVTTLSATTDGDALAGALVVEQAGSGPAITAHATQGSEAGVAAFGGDVGVIASGTSYAVHGTSDGLVAVWGEGIDDTVGVVGSSEEAGPGVCAMSGLGPALFLKPTATPGPPLEAWDGIGAVSIDVNGDLWLCTGAGDPPTWTRLLREDTAVGRTVPITPIRALDTRATGGRALGAPAVPGQVKGPIHGGQTVTLDLAGIAPIPATASGVIGNATLVSPAGTGFLRILPAGATIPACSFNFYSGRTVSNGFTSALPANGLSAVAPVGSSVTYHLVIDIAAYIT